MAEEIEFRFPSIQPYAYVSVKGTAEELSKLDMEQLASLYTNSLFGFMRYEQAAVDYIAAERQRPADEPGIKADGDVGVVKVHPDGLEATEAAVAELDKQLGATEIDDVNAAPYKQPAPAAKAKPWETEKPAPKAVVDVAGW